MSVQQPAESGTNGLAITSLVLAIIWVGGLASVAAVITGVVARRQIRDSRQGGDGLAIAGLVLGILGALPLVVVLVVFGLGRLTATIT